jgi:predicted amidohydrolase
MTRRLNPLVLAVMLIPALDARGDDLAPRADAGAAPAQTQSDNPRSKSDQPPRKVVVGTMTFGPYGDYPGLEARLAQLGSIIDTMAEQAERAYPGRGLDLAILTESAVNPTVGTASERAIRLEGPVRDAFAALARKHKCYIVTSFDMAEDGPEGTYFSNAAVLFDRRGEVAGIYRKVHPVAVAKTNDLEGGITPGAEYPVFDCDFGKLGIQICWDIQFEEGWKTLAGAGAELIAWPSASPATALPTARSAKNRVYIVSSTWRDNATVFEPTGMVAAQVRGHDAVLVHELDLSYAIVGWSSFLKDGAALSDKYGAKVGYHYDPSQDMGLFWSNDPTTTIGAMVRSIGAEELDAQIARNRRLYQAAQSGGSGLK